MGSQALGIGSRTLLNSSGSGLIGGGVTLAQNAFKKAILHQNIGLLDGVENNARLSAVFGGLGSLGGDLIETGVGSVRETARRMASQYSWNHASLEAKLFSLSLLQSFPKKDLLPSILGTFSGNVFSNSSPLLPLLPKDNKQK